MIIKIECVLPLMVAILIFRCTEGADVGDDTLPQVRLGTTENQDGRH